MKNQIKRTDNRLCLIPVVDMDYLETHDPKDIAEGFGPLRELTEEEAARFRASSQYVEVKCRLAGKWSCVG